MCFGFKCDSVTTATSTAYPLRSAVSCSTACGFAIGVERVLELMRARGDGAAQPQCDVYVVHHGDETLDTALRTINKLGQRFGVAHAPCPGDQVGMI